MMSTKHLISDQVRKMPVQKPGRSKQDYATPMIFIEAVKDRWALKEFDWDLAANARNRKAPRWLGPGSSVATDALSFDWTGLVGNLWLNPPFSNIEPWAMRCNQASLRKERYVFFLTPASVGANWYAKWVHRRARVYFLNGRLSFDGKDPYPKDCMLSVFGEKPGFEVWRWQ